MDHEAYFVFIIDFVIKKHFILLISGNIFQFVLFYFTFLPYASNSALSICNPLTLGLRV